jgi:hypothetical protein
VTLLELAERCEKAEGRDRVLDGDIADALDLAPGWAGERLSGLNQATWSTGRDYWDAPAFTRSLDAALTLVPEGLEWELLAYDAKRDPRFGRFQARIMLLTYTEDPEELGPQAIANGTAPALALTAAALRARAAQ